MKIRDVQTKMASWIHEHFPNQSLPIQALQLAEEVGEVSRCVVKKHQGIRPDVWEGLPKELADVFISLVSTAVAAGVDLEAEVEKRLPVILERDWTEHRKNLQSE